MAKESTANSIDKYIAGFPSETQKVLEELRALIKAAAPTATEKISYGMPTFYLNGNLVHFAGWQNHIGLYPTPSGIEAFDEELKPYKRAKEESEGLGAIPSEPAVAHGPDPPDRRAPGQAERR